MRRPHNTASQWNRRTRTTSRTGLPANGRSAKRRRYRLWIRPDLVPQSRTDTRHAQWTDGDERRVGLTAGSINNKAARNEARQTEGLAHGIDSFCETSATRRHNVIKTESEPKLHAYRLESSGRVITVAEAPKPAPRSPKRETYNSRFIALLSRPEPRLDSDGRLDSTGQSASTRIWRACTQLGSVRNGRIRAFKRSRKLLSSGPTGRSGG